MAFPTLNRVLSSGVGMSGTTRPPLSPPPVQPQPMASSPMQRPTGWHPQPSGSGGQSEVSTIWDNVGKGHGGMLGTKPQGGASQYITGGNSMSGGVNAGAPAPVLQQPAAGPAFDPNDPDNAALAGYMRG